METFLKISALVVGGVVVLVCGGLAFLLGRAAWEIEPPIKVYDYDLID